VAVVAAGLSTVAHWWLDSTKTEQEEQKEVRQLASLPMAGDNRGGVRGHGGPLAGR